MLLIIKHNHKVYSKVYYRLFIIQLELLRNEILETYIGATDIAIGYYSLLYNHYHYKLTIQLLVTTTTTTKPKPKPKPKPLQPGHLFSEMLLLPKSKHTQCVTYVLHYYTILIVLL